MGLLYHSKQTTANRYPPEIKGDSERQASNTTHLLFSLGFCIAATKFKTEMCFFLKMGHFKQNTRLYNRKSKNNAMT